MKITDVRIRLLDGGNDRLKAYCSVTFDHEFVVKDIKIIGGPKGLFVAMPSRKLADRCPRCNTKNPLRARYCSQCGKRLPQRKIPVDEANRPKLHADIAHPITPACREALEKQILDAYNTELEKSKQPGYKPTNIYSPEELDLDERQEAQQPPSPQQEPPKSESSSGQV